MVYIKYKQPKDNGVPNIPLQFVSSFEYDLKVESNVQKLHAESQSVWFLRKHTPTITFN